MTATVVRPIRTAATTIATSESISVTARRQGPAVRWTKSMSRPFLKARGVGANRSHPRGETISHLRRLLDRVVLVRIRHVGPPGGQGPPSHELELRVAVEVLMPQRQAPFGVLRALGQTAGQEARVSPDV